MAVEIRAVTKRFGDHVALDGVSARIDDKTFVTFLGPSGCGKTTLLRLLAGFIAPDGGEILLDGDAISSPEHVRPPEQRGMGMVFQTFAVWPHMTVFENVAYGLRLRKVRRDEIRARVTGALGMVKLASLEARYPAQLSGGQQQRVALARSIVVEPRILLLDEPLSNLDAKLRKEMWPDLREIQRRVGIAFVYVTHDQAEALSISDEIVVLNRGQVEQVGSPGDVYERPRSAFVAGFIGSSTFVDGTVVAPAPAGEAGAVDLEGGARLRGRFSRALPVGTPATVCIRPDAVTLLEAPSAPADNVLEGKVVAVQYFGDAEEVTLQTRDLLLTARSAPGRVSVGAAVWARLDAARCLVFGKE